MADGLFRALDLPVLTPEAIVLTRDLRDEAEVLRIIIENRKAFLAAVDAAIDAGLIRFEIDWGTP